MHARTHGQGAGGAGQQQGSANTADSLRAQQLAHPALGTATGPARTRRWLHSTQCRRGGVETPFPATEATMSTPVCTKPLPDRARGTTVPTQRHSPVTCQRHRHVCAYPYATTTRTTTHGRRSLFRSGRARKGGHGCNTIDQHVPIFTFPAPISMGTCWPGSTAADANDSSTSSTSCHTSEPHPPQPVRGR